MISIHFDVFIIALLDRDERNVHVTANLFDHVRHESDVETEPYRDNCQVSCYQCLLTRFSIIVHVQNCQESKHVDEKWIEFIFGTRCQVERSCHVSYEDSYSEEEH